MLRMFKVQLLDRNETVEVNEKIKVSEVAKKFGYNLESVIFLRNGMPIPDDEIPSDDDLIVIMKAFSGG